MAGARRISYSSTTDDLSASSWRIPMRTLVSASALALSLVAAAANAQAVRTERALSLDLANQIASVTVAASGASGYAVIATVVDRAGTVRAVQRADNAGPHTLAASLVKAFT